MVNKLKDIVNKLDGCSFENQGFAVTSFAPAEGGSGIKLQVKPYIRNEGIEGIPEEEHLKEIPEEEHLKEMVSRLLSRYSDAPRYAVYKAEKVNGGLWELTVHEIQEKTEEADEV